MPLFEYKCPDCGLVEEHIVFSTKDNTPTKPCGRCKAASVKLAFPTSISLARSGMDNAPVDNFIGKDAETRWKDIRKRQELRDKVRSEAGAAGLSMVGRNDFVPLTETQKELRTSVNEAVASGGSFKPSEPVPGS